MRSLLVVCAALSLARAAGAATIDGHEWPPDPSRYAAPGTEVAPGLKVGDVLDASNAGQAKDLLPPEILEHYHKGDYHNRIDSWPEGLVHRDVSNDRATKENVGKYVLDPDSGAILEKTSGKVPESIYGMPFPEIAADDPQGGLKALWNQYHNYWNNGSYFFQTSIVWVGRTGVERSSVQDVWWQYYDNQNPRYRVPNPQGFAWQSLTDATSPADLQGTASLTWRFRDPKKRDSVWAFVPALRRIRAVSPANRSDGVLGSDLSQDDGNFLDMKPEDFVWKTIGLREGLRIAEPDSIHGHGGPLKVVEGGGIRDTWPKATPAAGFQDKSWKGVAWAPAGGVLVKRKMWVVEGVPRDRYYLYGKIQAWIDAESWIGAWNRKFSWKDELLNDYEVAAYLHHPVEKDGEIEWIWSAQHAWQAAEVIKADRATLAGFRLSPDHAFDRRVTHNIDQLFDYGTLSRFGK